MSRDAAAASAVCFVASQTRRVALTHSLTGNSCYHRYTWEWGQCDISSSSSVSGYRVSPQTLNAIIKRYNKRGRIFFDDYVACCVRLRALTGMRWPDMLELPLTCRCMLWILIIAELCWKMSDRFLFLQTTSDGETPCSRDLSPSSMMT